MNILAYISIRIAVLTHCQNKENPCSNQEIHVKILEMSSELFAWGYTESIEDQTDHFAEVFVCENVVYSYDIVTALWRSKVYSWCHFFLENQCK